MLSLVFVEGIFIMVILVPWLRVYYFIIVFIFPLWVLIYSKSLGKFTEKYRKLKWEIYKIRLEENEEE